MSESISIIVSFVPRSCSNSFLSFLFSLAINSFCALASSASPSTARTCKKSVRMMRSKSRLRRSITMEKTSGKLKTRIRFTWKGGYLVCG